MSKKMLINATHPEENRVAIVEDGILSELDIEVAGKEQTKGNIYKGVVVRVEPGLQAAFIDYGAERLGFLQMGELHPSFFQPFESNPETKGRPRITDILRRGQEFLVQIVKEERGTKGAALTTYLSLPGRYMVLMPDSDTKGVSRKIEEEAQRKKLKAAMASLDLPGNMGYIVRTAGIGQTTEELKRDFDYLVRVYQKIQGLSKQAKAPALIYKESNLVIRSIRDYFTHDMDEVLVDDPKVFQEARDFFQEVMPEYARLVKLHQERRPIFSRYQIEEQIETISKNKVPLPSGGSIVLDATEALVAVDVNSGKMAGEQGVEATAYKTNLEAATEVGRQLRLRDLGGLIVIDFIDMRDRKHIREVEKAVKDALKNDKARVTVGRISSQFGLLEMSRQRIKATLAEGSYLPCPHCDGTGRLKSPEAQSVAFLRKIQAGIAKGQIGRVEGEIPLDVATYLLNNKRSELMEMERQHRLAIYIKGRPDILSGQSALTFIRREEIEESQEEFVEATVAATDNVPAEEVVTEEAATDETEGGAKKKRRRRRRKKKAEELPTAAETETEAQTETETSPAEAESLESGPTPSVEEAAAPAAPEPPPVPPAEAAQPADETEEQPLEAEEAKKRKRRRRRKKPVEAQAETAAAPDSEAVAASAESAAQPAPEPPSLPPTPAAAEPAPPEARPKAVESSAVAQELTTAGEEPETTAKGPSPEEEISKPARPRTRARKPKAPPPSPSAGTEPKAPDAAGPEPGATPQPEAASTAAQASEDSGKPKKRPQRRPRAAAQKAETAAAAEEQPTAAPGAEPEPAPATTATTAEDKPKAPRKRRAVNKKKEPAEGGSEAIPAPQAQGMDAPVQDVKEKAPAKRRTRTKKDAEAETASAAETTDSASRNEKGAPKPPTTRSRARKPAAAEGKTETAETPTDEAKPKRRAPRKKAPAKKDENPPESSK